MCPLLKPEAQVILGRGPLLAQEPSELLYLWGPPDLSTSQSTAESLLYKMTFSLRPAVVFLIVLGAIASSPAMGYEHPKGQDLSCVLSVEQRRGTLAPVLCLGPWGSCPWLLNQGCPAFSYLLPSLHSHPQELSLLL